jgi:hypothetical protein
MRRKRKGKIHKRKSTRKFLGGFPENKKYFLIISTISLSILVVSLAILILLGSILSELLQQKEIEKSFTGYFVTFGTSQSVTRTISPSTISPNGEVSVTLNVIVNYSGPDRFYFLDEIVPASWPGDWELVDDGTLVDAGEMNASQRGHLKKVVINSSGVEDGQYTYTVRVNATEGTYTFSGTYQIEGMGTPVSITGDTQLTVQQGSEICNDIDDNGVGGVDEGCDDDVDYYADDFIQCSGSFRDGTGQLRLCSVYGGDCDDTDPDVHPGASERCNGVRDDCSGAQVDEGCDDDSDDYCDATMTIVVGSSISTCVNTITTDSGTIASTDDCNDTNYDVNPGELELCNDANLDDNCDGVVDNVGGGTTRETAHCQCYGGAAPLASELCDNGIDDDCDQNIDEAGCIYGDSDGDGVPDDTDNCPEIWNPSQNDTDGQNGGDPCDICPSDAFDDSQDNDGICVGEGFCQDAGVCGEVKLGEFDNCPEPATHAILTNSMILMVTDIVQETALIHPR